MTGFPTSQWPTFELRPRRTSALRWEELRNDSARMLLMVVLFGFLAIQLAGAALSGDTGTIALGGAMMAGIFGASFVVMSRMRLRVKPDAIERVGVVRVTCAARHDVIGVVRVPVESAGMQQGNLDLLVDREGRCLLRFYGRLWKDGDLDRAWAHAGLGIQLAGQTMTYKQLEAWIPGSTRYVERRPFAFAMWFTGALIALTVIATVVAVAIAPTAP